VGRWAQAVVVHGGEWTQAARGTASRANVRLCLASSFLGVADLHIISFHLLNSRQTCSSQITSSVCEL